MTIELITHVATLGFFIAFIFSIKLYLETDRKWFWLSFCVATFSFLITHVLKIFWPFSTVNNELLAFIQEFGGNNRGFSFAVACYGIYREMKSIKGKIGMNTILFYWSKGADMRVKIIKIIADCERQHDPCYINIISQKLGSKLCRN